MLLTFKLEKNLDEAKSRVDALYTIVNSVKNGSRLKSSQMDKINNLFLTMDINDVESRLALTSLYKTISDKTHSDNIIGRLIDELNGESTKETISILKNKTN